jgi:hypothetical protein
MAEENDPMMRLPLPRRPQLPGITRPRGLSDAPLLDNIAGDHQGNETVTDPQIVCPNCRTHIKLTESLAEPLVAQARSDQIDHRVPDRSARPRREAVESLGG